jgi:hypothetical protein
MILGLNVLPNSYYRLDIGLCVDNIVVVSVRFLVLHKSYAQVYTKINHKHIDTHDYSI